MVRIAMRMILGLAILAILPCIAAPESTMPLMKAVIIREYGGPEVLKLEDVARPEPKENEILVRVIAAGVNPIDALLREGTYAKEFGTRLPLVPGCDIAGVVEKAGKKVAKLKVGDAVYGYVREGGGYAEYAVATEEEVSPKPKSLSFVAASAVPLAALTAWQALIDGAKLKAGQTVLIHGGSGGVGTMAIQIAKARGAHVIATASTPNQDLLKELGADVAIDYSKTKFEDAATNVDVVLDSVGKDTLARSYGVVKKGGFIATLVSRLDQAELDKRGIRGASISVMPNAKELAEITKLIEAKQVKPVVTRMIALADAVNAQQQIATQHTRGKIVLRIADEPVGKTKE
jgi:NADPH:quinone reductase-like Zn-dependent oxidoreductase